MFSIDDYVVYGTTGVCKIADIRTDCFGCEEKEYYILQPVYTKNSTLYVPTDSQTVKRKMKPILSEDEINELIRAISDEKAEWIKEDSARREKFTGIIKNGDRKELLKLIKALHLHKKDRVESGRKLNNTDENFMKTAEKLIYDEFAFVLNIKPDDVLPYIMEQIKS
ncbi:MAG: CarD family transcriptional regulator [Clostridiales bacterium]|nr:CarD family transcriptional regulator [Clostridiales bacterium]